MDFYCRYRAIILEFTGISGVVFTGNAVNKYTGNRRHLFINGIYCNPGIFLSPCRSFDEYHDIQFTHELDYRAFRHPVGCAIRLINNG